MASKLKLKPLGGRVIVEPIEQEDITAGGIILPETAKEKPQEGKILAAGPGERDEDGEYIPMEVKIGDKGAVCKVFWHRGESGWQETAYPERK